MAVAGEHSLAVTSGLLHLGYFLFLSRSYRTGDLSQVLPHRTRSGALSTLIGTWAFVHEEVTMTGGARAWRFSSWHLGDQPRRPAGPAARRDDAVLRDRHSVFIATYTIVDGMGGRVSGAASGYAGLVFVFDSIFLSIAALGMRGPRIVKEVAPYWKTGVAGAFLSVGGLLDRNLGDDEGADRQRRRAARNQHSRRHAALHARAEGNGDAVAPRGRGADRRGGDADRLA